MVIMAAPSMRIKAVQSAGVVWSEQASSGWVTLRSRNCTKLGIAVASGKSNSPVAPAELAIPANWEQLRWHWEYPHAANALITFVAFCSVTLSVLATRE
jgi:hypothetical protein